MEVGNYSISCRLKNVENEVVWTFTGVYGPCNRKEREMLWEELGAIRGIWDEPWCIGGDFNVTLSQRDRSRQGSLNGAMRRFAQVVDDLALIDLPLQGGLPRPTSDHFPILLKGGGMSGGPSPFRFENMWLKVDGFKELLREWWQGGERVRRASFRMAAKMKDLSERETDMKNEAKENFKKWVLLEEAHWRQMSRELWLKEGDKNTGPGRVHCGLLASLLDFAKEEIVELFKELYDQKSFAKSLNATFLVIIPKKGGAEDLGEFRPISLLGGLYKIMAKVLANRLKMVLDKVVSDD
ncbi:hypothetical protein CK203_076997 [Vitis vinifera]|uniref:Endonuclease/exonuclease/phosphatase domain-containing protein n=1 Tax=Vitis vinifera TaxID=29760 RepID=A0A438DZM5_VITVI|nr:hypothetical protein CK203_076997 [Vitis vinifera]